MDFMVNSEMISSMFVCIPSFLDFLSIYITTGP